MKYFRIVSGEWYECEKSDLVVGDKFTAISDGSILKSYWGGHGVTNRSKIVITSHAKRALVEVGNSLTVTAEIRDADDNLLPATDSFAMPVGRVGGANYRTIMMDFVDGVCNKTITWNDAGEFEVTESMINMHLDENSKLEFSGFNISVAE